MIYVPYVAFSRYSYVRYISYFVTASLIFYMYTRFLVKNLDFFLLRLSIVAAAIILLF